MEGRHSGVEEYTVQIIEHMARAAPRHTFHLFYNSARPVSLPPFPANISIHSFRYPNTLFNGLQATLGIPRWDKLVPGAVFFVPNPRLMPLTAVTPLVTVVHDLSFERFPEFFDWRRRVWHRLMQPRTLMRNSDHIIAVSEHTKGDLIDLYGIDEQAITVIHSGVPAGAGLARPTDVHHVRQKYSLPKKFILYFGTLEPRKNAASIIRAFEAISEQLPHHLIIAGEKGWKQQAVYRLLERGKSQRKVHLLGFVPEEEKYALYAAADLFVYPSFYEGFGFPPLEALLAGTPVITSFNSALPEVVGQWATLVDPYDTAQLAAVMFELLSFPRRVPDSVRQAIRERYSWKKAAQDTLRVIESVV